MDLLARGELRLVGRLPYASNNTFLVEVTARGRSVPAVYKPERGEAPLWDFPEGTLAGREVAAYELSRALGWPAVPPTVLRDGPYGEGAVQLHVDASFEEHFFTLREARLDEFRPIAAFDVVANNADRKGGHCLVDPRGTIWAIDHGLCFHRVPKLRTVIWEFAGSPMPTALLEDVRRVGEDLRSGELRRSLGRLLAEAEVEATAERVGALAEAGAFPHPGPGRVVPWPPI